MCYLNVIPNTTDDLPMELLLAWKSWEVGVGLPANVLKLKNLPFTISF